MTTHTTPASGAADLPEALYADAVKFAKERASISYVQRKCRCSYNKAERMLEQMVADGIIQTYNWRKDAALTAQAISEAPDHVADLGNMVERAISAEPAAHVQNPAENEHVADDMSKNGAEMIMSTQPVAQQGAAYAALPEPLEIDWPELHSQALGCGVEDRGLHSRYECAEYGWQDGVDKCAERVPEQIFDADQMRAFADATHTLRAESLAALDRARIRDIFMAHGFMVKDGQTDLKQYVYDAADALLSAARAPADSVLEDAARYQWLRQHWFTMSSNYKGCITFRIGEPRWSDITEEALDAAIDSARKQGGSHDHT